jgi:hypothetical protein
MLYPSSHERLEVFLSLGGSPGGVECLFGGEIFCRLASVNDKVLLDVPRPSSGSTPLSKSVDIDAMLRGWCESSPVVSSLSLESACRSRKEVGVIGKFACGNWRPCML